jgi:hypothetical protein
MHSSLLVVDDFLDNAEGLRAAALRLTYPAQQGAFPGRNSLERINIEGLADEVSNLVGEPLKPIDPLESHAKCRITLAADIGRAKVHIDHSHWSGILYLSRPEDSKGGTDFFRHLPTNSDRAPIYEEGLGHMGFSSYEEMHRAIIEKDSLDDRKWERNMTVPMRFNRLLLLRPWLWHTAGPGFGDRLENGRLVYLMFFASARPGASQPRQG